ncbi:MAG TPA: hypothetical protein VNZ43_14470 [Sphingomonadaceae bacterium]|jgi:ElaB/YqjD/DUF883 family membrane-anchored ribosome-binding protein|nr:hypothetical protein [Sphingomonadaceae bacterium]
MTTATTDSAAKIRAAADQAREKAEQAYASAREKAGQAYGNAREGAKMAGQRTAASIEDNPLVALLGAAAVGILAGALLPASERESGALGPLGGKLREAGKTAFSAAKDAGRETLDQLGINEAAAREQLSKLVDAVVQTASSAGDAAAKSVRD